MLPIPAVSSPGCRRQIVNQAVILIGYWWAGLLNREVWRLTWLYAVPAVAGLAAGMLFFHRLRPAPFPPGVFAGLFLSGLVLLVPGRSAQPPGPGPLSI